MPELHHRHKEYLFADLIILDWRHSAASNEFFVQIWSFC